MMTAMGLGNYVTTIKLHCFFQKSNLLIFAPNCSCLSCLFCLSCLSCLFCLFCLTCLACLFCLSCGNLLPRISVLLISRRNEIAKLDDFFIVFLNVFFDDHVPENTRTLSLFFNFEKSYEKSFLWRGHAKFFLGIRSPIDVNEKGSQTSCAFLHNF